MKRRDALKLCITPLLCPLALFHSKNKNIHDNVRFIYVKFIPKPLDRIAHDQVAHVYYDSINREEAKHIKNHYVVPIFTSDNFKRDLDSLLKCKPNTGTKCTVIIFHSLDKNHAGMILLGDKEHQNKLQMSMSYPMVITDSSKLTYNDIVTKLGG